MVRQLDLGVEIDRSPPQPTLLPFLRFFRGFAGVAPVRSTFGTEADAILADLTVEFVSSRFVYMAVSHRDAHLIVSTWHLRNSDFRTLYLDIVHELFHVGQFRDSRASFLAGYTRLVRDPLSYFRNPIEIAAYKHTVAEALRIGLTKQEIAKYLEVGWAAPKEHLKFLETIGLGKRPRSATHPRRPRVRIARRAPVTLRPFTDFFHGFEAVPGVRSLWGNRTEQVLHRLKVEFYSLPLGYIGLDHAGGYVIVSTPYLRDADMSTLYLDVFFALQVLKQFLEGRLLVPLSPGWTRAMKKYSREHEAREAAYPDDPSSLEAYRPTIAEARRIGMSEPEIRDYLLAPEIGGMTPERHARLLENLGLSAGRSHG